MGSDIYDHGGAGGERVFCLARLRTGHGEPFDLDVYGEPRQRDAYRAVYVVGRQQNVFTQTQLIGAAGNITAMAAACQIAPPAGNTVTIGLEKRRYPGRDRRDRRHAGNNQ